MTKSHMKVLALLLALVLAGLVVQPGAVQAQQTVDFTTSALAGENLTNPTSLQFGPDGRLYVAQQNGTIYAYTVERNGANDYEITATETINLVKNFIPNHDDDGTPNPESKRQVTGIYVTGTGAQPVLYVGSSDSRIGAGGEKGDVDLDTNSSTISRLTCTGGLSGNTCSNWDKVDLVRGLPRSEENHSINGLALDPALNVLYVAMGGNTNGGAPSNNFASITEYAYAAAILSVDLTEIDNLPVQQDTTLYPGYTYQWVLDLPTLDDPTRPNANGIDNPSTPGYDGVDENDPFGGNDGLNQAKVTVDSPVQIHSPGWRNAYDVILTYPDGPMNPPRMYSVDNGANPDWGGHPEGEADYDREATVAACTNDFVVGEGGSTENNPGPGGDLWVNNKNGLHYVRELQSGEFNFVQAGEKYYAGHPTPLRANPTGAGLYTVGDHTVDPDTGDNSYWRNAVVLDSDGVPIPGHSLPFDWNEIYPASLVDPAECDFRNSGEMDGALANYNPSTNGLAEYTASNLSGKFQGDLLAAGFNGTIFRAVLSADGKTVTNCNDPASIYADNLAYLQNGGDPSQPFDGTDGIKTVKSCNETFASGFGSVPLDVIAQGDDPNIFPGTVWAITYGSEGSSLGGGVTVFEPTDYDGGSGQICDDTNNDVTDGDNDGYTNADEIQNGTNECSGAEVPQDFDKTFEFGSSNQFLRSDLLDPDDDNDTLPDTVDRFPLDCGNGFGSMTCDPGLVNTANLPIEYNLLNNDPGFGFGGIGFTGLMTDGVTDYYNLQTDPNRETLIFGGTSGLFTIPTVGPGNPDGANTTAVDDFQFGLNVDQNSDPFTVVTTINTPVFNGSPTGDQSFGMFVGTGDMNNFVKVVVHGNNGSGGVQFIYEEAGTPVITQMYDTTTVPSVDITSATSNIRLYLFVNPQTGLVIPGVELDGDLLGAQMPTQLGSGTTVTGNVLSAIQGNFTVNSLPSAMAAGVISTSGTSGSNYSATWDSIYVEEVLSDATATVLIDTGNLNGGSTFADDSITITNTSTGMSPANIDSVTLDLRDTILTDIVFDPDGTAGDTASKGFSPNAGTEVTTGVTSHSFGDPANGTDGDDGYYTLTINFAPGAFAPGEQLQFGVDADPLSTKGTAAPGPSDAASVNGMELSGTRATVAFDNGDTHDVQLFSVVDSKPGLDADADSENIVRNQIPGTPNVNMLSVTAPAVVTEPMQTVRVSGPVQSDVKLIHVEAGLYVEAGGYQIDPLEVNKAVAFTEYVGTTSNDGTVDFDVTLTKTDADSGYNLFAAVVIDDDGATSDLSDVIVIEYDALAGNAEPPPAGNTLLRINTGGEEYIDTNNDTWVEDQDFIGGSCNPGSCNPKGSSPAIDRTENDELYQTERFEEDFDYVFPVANGTYTLDLYFAELFFGVNGNTGGVGSRVFDVTIEGNVVLDDYDIFAEIGPATAIVERIENIVVSDGTLNINFNSEAGANNASVGAIHIFEPTGGGTEVPITIGDYMDSDLTSITQDIVSRQFEAIGGDAALQYTATGLPSGLSIDLNSGLISGTIAAGAENGGTLNDGVYDVTITVDDSDGNNADIESVSFQWTVLAPITPSLARINAGGPQYVDSNTNTWSTDQNFTGGDCNPAICEPNGSSPAIEVTTDDPLYQTERFEEDFNYTIGVANGTYTLDLHFAELFFGVGTNPGGVGSRVFDVTIEGNVVLDDYDIFAEVGPATATVQRIENIVVSDGILNINFNSAAGANNAKISAIHVYEAPDAGGDTPITVGNYMDSDLYSVTQDVVSRQFEAIGGDAALQYTATGLPSGLSMDLNSGLISGTIAAGAETGGTLNDGVHDVTITIDDSDGDNADVQTVTFQWTVFEALTPSFVRINAGGPQYTDSNTNTWNADQNFSGGACNPVSCQPNGSSPAISVTMDDPLYQTERVEENFDYTIAVQNGTYTLDLHFAEIFFGVGTNPGGVGSRVFDVTIEGNVVLDDYDIVADSGPAISVVRRFEGIAVTDGTLNINFNSVGGVNNAKVSAIHVYEAPDATGDIPISIGNGMDSSLHSVTQDIVSRQFVATGGDGALEYTATGLPAGLTMDMGTGLISGTVAAGAESGGNGNGVYAVTVTVDDGDADNTDVQTVNFQWTVLEQLSPTLLRINSGGMQYTDSQGNIWVEDQNFSSGACNPPSCAPQGSSPDIDVTTDDTLYQTERVASTVTYDIPVTNGTYTLDLHFAEIFFGVDSHMGGVGSRVFDVIIEGNTVLDDYDIFADSGPAIPAIKRFEGIVVADGAMSITVDAATDGVNNAKISAIQIYEPTGAEITIATGMDANQFNLPLDAVNKQIEASGGGAALEYTATGLPAGLTMALNTGIISGTIDAGAATGGNGNGVYNVAVTVDDDGNNTNAETVNFQWIVSEPTEETAVLYRVNVGGTQVAATDASTPAWSEDSAGNQSPFLTLSGGNSISQTPDAIALSDPSVSGGPAPEAVFQIERTGPMQWAFPVEQSPAGNGLGVEVRLYLAETSIDAGNVGGSGERIFDVEVEGSVPTAFDDINTYRNRGHDTAHVRFVRATVTDGVLNVNLVQNVGSPALQAIEIVTTEGIPTITAPVDMASIVDTEVTVEYTPGSPNDGNTQYQVQIASDSGFATVVYDSDAITATSVTETLAAGTYYVRVRQGSSTTNVNGLWSSTVQFTLEDEEPIVLSAIPNQFNLEGEQSTITVGASGGNGNLAYGATGLPTGLIIEPTNGQITGIIAAGAENGGTNSDGIYNVTITVDDSDGSNADAVTTNFTWVVSNPVDEAQVLYRVNVGGDTAPAADATQPDWSADTQAASSAFLAGFTPTSGTGFNQTADTVGLANVSVAGGPAPQAVFQTERDGNMQWAFPVDAGTNVEVRLYFAEIVLTDNTAPRIFDVAIEGTVPAAFDDIDQFGTRGHDAAFMRYITTVMADGTLNVDVTSVSNGATLKGIEVVTTEAAPTITAPTNAQVLANTTVDITLAPGTPNSGTQNYIVQVATDSAFTNVVYDSGTINTTTTQAALPGDGTYYVRARQTDGVDDTSIWSDVVVFTISNTDGNVLQNPDFSQNTTAYTFVNATPNVVSEVLQVSRTDVNNGFGFVKQTADSFFIPTGANIEASIKLGNTGASAKRVAIQVATRDNMNNVLGSAICEFTVPASPTLTEYALRAQSPLDITNVDFDLIFEDFNDGQLLVDDAYFGQPADISGATFTSVNCVTPDTPGNANLVVNSLFNGALAQFGVEGDVTRSVNSGILNATRSNASSNAAITQQMAFSTVANAPLQTTIQLGNSSNRSKHVTVRLANGANAAEAMQCQFTVPANMQLKNYTMLGETPSAWDSIEFELLLEDYNVNSLTADNISIIYNPGVTAPTTACTPGVPNGGTPVNVNGDFNIPNAQYSVAGGLGYTWQNGVVSISSSQGGTAQSIAQTLRYNNVPANIPLQLAVDLSNSGSVDKTMTLRMWDGANAANAITCDVTVYANTTSQTYTLQGLTNVIWNNIQLELLVDNFSGDGNLTVDNLAMTYEPVAGITGTNCDTPPGPNMNLLTNGDFGTGDTAFDFTGAISYTATGGQIAVTRTDEEDEAKISQTAPANIPANGRVLAGVHLNNPTGAEKVVRLKLAQTSTSSYELFCFFTLPANTPVTQYAVGGFTDVAWSSVYFELTVLDDGTPSLFVDNAEVEYRPNAPFTQDFCYEGAIPGGATPSSIEADATQPDDSAPVIEGAVVEPAPEDASVEPEAPVVEGAAVDAPVIESADGAEAPVIESAE